MRLLANENVPAALVEALGTRGHDVLWVRTASPGITDLQVLRKAASEDRVLLTFDKDFGELAYREQPAAVPGIILVRLAPVSAAHITRLVVMVLEERDDWAGHFAVISEGRVRLTPLPRHR